MPEFRYYIGYSASSNINGAIEVGGREITCDRPIRSMADVLDAQQSLRSCRGNPSLIVTGFSRFED